MRERNIGIEIGIVQGIEPLGACELGGGCCVSKSGEAGTNERTDQFDRRDEVPARQALQAQQLADRAWTLLERIEDRAVDDGIRPPSRSVGLGDLENIG